MRVFIWSTVINKKKNKVFKLLHWAEIIIKQLMLTGLPLRKMRLHDHTLFGRDGSVAVNHERHVCGVSDVRSSLLL